MIEREVWQRERVAVWPTLVYATTIRLTQLQLILLILGCPLP